MLRPNPTIARWMTAASVGALTGSSLTAIIGIVGASTSAILGLGCLSVMLFGTAPPLRTISKWTRIGLFLPALLFWFSDLFVYWLANAVRVVSGDTLAVYPVATFLFALSCWPTARSARTAIDTKPERLI